MFYGIDVPKSPVPKDRVINRAGVCQSGRQVIEGKPGKTLREQVKVLRTFDRDVVRRLDLGDGSELFVVEPPSNMSDDVVRTWRTRSTGVVCPNQLQGTIELVPKVANGHRTCDAELGVVNCQ